jgi:hypothetical protein
MSKSSYVGCTVECEPLLRLSVRLVSDEANYCTDISRVDGFSASKSPLTDFSSIAEMVEQKCPSYIEQMTEAGLAKMLRHYEIRILRPIGDQGSDHFSNYSWDGRLFLSNSGGSHHFAAAQVIAQTLAIPLALHGRLYHHALDPNAVADLNKSFAIFAMCADLGLTHGFYEAMRAFDVPFCWCDMPHPYKGARAVFLPRSNKRAIRIAQMLCDHSFFDIGAHLTQLAAAQVTPPGVRLVETRSHIVAC